MTTLPLGGCLMSSTRRIAGEGHAEVLLHCIRGLAIELSTHDNIDECRATVAALVTDLPADEWQARATLARFLATSTTDQLRDGKLAVELATKACELTQYKNPEVLDALAAAYAETGDFALASKWAQKAMDEATDDRVRNEIKKHLESFESHKPLRDTPAAPTVEKPADIQDLK